MNITILYKIIFQLFLRKIISIDLILILIDKICLCEFQEHWIKMFEDSLAIGDTNRLILLKVILLLILLNWFFISLFHSNRKRNVFCTGDHSTHVYRRIEQIFTVNICNQNLKLFYFVHHYKERPYFYKWIDICPIYERFELLYEHSKNIDW